jgi:phage gp29-like protein
MVGDRVEQEDAQLIESSGANWQTFESYLSTSAADVAITLLGQNLTTEVKGGSYAAAQAHQEVKRELVAADAERFQTALREQLIIPWGSYNWEGFSPEDAPWELWRTEAESDRAREGQVLVSVVDSVSKARTEGIELDLEQVEDKTGWKVRLGEKPEPPVQQPPRTPGAAPSGSKTKALQVPDEDAEGCSHAFDPTMATQQPDADAWQDYALRVGDDLANEGARALDPTLAAVLRAISQADSFEDALARMEAAYASALTPDELIELTTSGLVMAQSAGIQGEEDDFNA